MKRNLLPVMAVVISFGGTVARGEHPVRNWTSNEGTKISASMISAVEDSVLLKLRNGREARVPLSRLSKADRDYVAELRRKGMAYKPGAIPEETSIDQSVEVDGGPRIFKTAHFQFEADQDISKGFIAEASRVFEGTFHAIQSLPFGIEPSPPKGMDRFRARFQSRSAFQAELATILQNRAGEGVAGVYLPLKKEILVPFTSMGAKERGSQMTLRRTSNTTTLVHEITHQVMHDWLPLIPIWLAEGMSEYMSAVPYQNGRFEFKNAARGLKERLEERYGTDSPRVIHPGDFLMGPVDQWQGSLDEYLSAMMLTYYFVHFDREGNGDAVSAYLALIRKARDETDSFILDYNLAVKEFEKDRVAFNAKVDSYNKEVATYRTAIEDYRKRIEQYNEQVKSGIPKAERIDVGEAPEPPVAPVKPEVPELISDQPVEGPIDMAAVAGARARPAFMRGRDLDEIAEEMRTAFAGIGIEIAVRKMNLPAGGFNQIGEGLKKRLEDGN